MKNKGFTLLEILIVIAILTILFAIITIYLNPPYIFSKSYDSQRLTDSNTLEKAIQQYFIDHKNYSDLDISKENQEICDTGFIENNLEKQIKQNGNCLGFLNMTKLVPTYLAGIPTEPLYLKNKIYHKPNLEIGNLIIGGNGYYVKLENNVPVVTPKYLGKTILDNLIEKRLITDIKPDILLIIIAILIILTLSTYLVWKNKK
ncbi:MAG TPA: type II secretion system protein [Candidatus Paceibacterota bacterium]|nr:type II secretion system protein [Candidatus Paceibacterota bacterium]HMP18893.1 type II secretion system protein [Candidatus Paceibacterota bacterium]HMP85054.1 type II secretion system protein [Candidatus Paceibacterota bacterium]